MYTIDGCPQLVIPESFQECYTYEMQTLYLAKRIDELQEQVDKLTPVEEES